MRIALLTSAIRGGNSGDAFIEDAVKRIVKADEFVRFPLLHPLNDDHLKGINDCDTAIICGTNLYQSHFPCSLNLENLDRIRVPVVPMGIGASAPIGQLPKMGKGSRRIVKKLHKKCSVSSVRDPASYKFLKSIGVRNTRLTACPVLFHGLTPPEFDLSSEGPFTLTPRARLLHVDSALGERQRESLQYLCKRYRPNLVIQSPHDQNIASQLTNMYGVRIVKDNLWQADVYVKEAVKTRATFGFRLHFGMLALSYGRPAHFVAHDSRVSEFCEMMGLLYFPIQDFRDDVFSFCIDRACIPIDGFRRNWNKYAKSMDSFLKRNALSSNLQYENTRRWWQFANPKSPRRPVQKPVVQLLVDMKRWAYDNSARRMMKELSDEFRFRISYVREKPNLRPEKVDVLFVYFWGETYYKKFGFDCNQIVKNVSSHRWQYDERYGKLDPQRAAGKYLRDAQEVVTTSRRLFDIFSEVRSGVSLMPNGVDAKDFRYKCERNGTMTIGCAGNAKDPIKGFADVVVPACERLCECRIAPGNIDRSKMNEFYNSLDILVVASLHEGEPLTLLEGMAAGCFPVALDVGIVPEVIEHKVNGYIVQQRTPPAFREAFNWCKKNIDLVRNSGKFNSRYIAQQRSWRAVAENARSVLRRAALTANLPKMLNEEVFPDTDLGEFTRFCRTFWDNGFHQIHGIVLRGRTSLAVDGRTSSMIHRKNVVDPFSRLRENHRAPKLERLEENEALLEFLRFSPDEIAFQGLHYTDFTEAKESELRDHFVEGLELLEKLFPRRTIRYCVAPFDKVSEDARNICSEVGLKLIGPGGHNLEDELCALELQPRNWYRYRHHHFYGETDSDEKGLSLASLKRALRSNRNVLEAPSFCS